MKRHATVALVLTALLHVASGDFVLRIAHTNDIHARFEEFNRFGSACAEPGTGTCYGGVARIHALVQKLRNEAGRNLLFLDAGDYFQGTLWFHYYSGNATAHFMNKLQYDAMVRQCLLRNTRVLCVECCQSLQCLKNRCIVIYIYHDHPLSTATATA